jgi:3'-phosphoadenosine 5'-phosphosulfate sulfotransferase (PAPS reductase)/FAD synthetase
VLLDLIAKTATPGRPRLAAIEIPVTWANTQMEYPGTEAFIRQAVKRYGMNLRIATAATTPLELWRRQGWPMLGKMAARLWMTQHPDRGFKINVSECCRTMKILPARRLTKALGCDLQFTGQRGQVDDNLRAMRDREDGAIFYQAKDKIWIANPLAGWSDGEIKGYLAANKIKQHPAKAAGAKMIGCVFCGGGSQYTNSGYRILRKTWPEAWRWFMVDAGAGPVILALKYKAPIEDVLQAVKALGGLGKLAEERPWIFDFTKATPLKGYDK